MKLLTYPRKGESEAAVIEMTPAEVRNIAIALNTAREGGRLTQGERATAAAFAAIQDELHEMGLMRTGHA